MDHSVSIDNSVLPSKIHFSDNFNVAVPFIDRHIIEGRSDKVAIRVHDGADFTFATLAVNVNRTGNTLIKLGLRKGDRVLMVIKDCPEFFYVFWGAIKAGFIPVPLNTLVRANDFSYMIKNSEAACIIYSLEFRDEVEPAIAQSSHKPNVILLTDGDHSTLAKHMADSSDTLAPVPAKPEDDCFWVYSSGSTGAPKGTVHAHRDMVITSQRYGVETLGVEEDDINFSAAKLFFSYGLGNALTFPLWVGGQTILYPGPQTPAIIHEIIKTYRPTIYYAVPTIYAAQLKAMQGNNVDLSSLRVCVSAGEALPPDLFQRWKEETKLTLLDGIGTTEILHIFISNRADDLRPGSSGKPVPGYSVKIVDDSGMEVPQGEQGNLLVKGDSLMKQYWKNPEKTASVLNNGWIQTGDIYYKDEEGFLFCCGRSDDMLKVAGLWCSPVEIEAKLVEHPKVLEAAIVGRADKDKLTKLEAFIVLKEPSHASEELSAELLNHCMSSLARYKFPRWINFVDELPKTATGKIQRFKLRA